MALRTIPSIGGVFTSNEPAKIILVLGIIALFICIGFTQSIAVDNELKSSMSTSNGITLYVGGTGEGNYTRIKDAIKNASVGDTVFVFDDSSPYYENISVNKSINLIGEDRDTTFIDGNHSGDVVDISADRVNISGFTIQNSSEYDAGIEIHSNYCNIFENIISNNNDGIIIGDFEFNMISGNDIISNNKVGIYLDSSKNNTIVRNNFINNKRDAFFKFNYIGPFVWGKNYWWLNYWNRPRILPKLIIGKINSIHDPWVPPNPLVVRFDIDWRPALKPYDIGV